MPTTRLSKPKYLVTLAALSAFSLSVALAQTPEAPADGSTSYMQSQPAPITRAPGQHTNQFDSQNGNQNGYGQGGYGQGQYGEQQQPRRPRMNVQRSQPAQGIYVSSRGMVTTVSATADRTELRVDRGVVNISVHHPEKHSLILVDFAGGQVDLIKDGFYTFNAQTKTFRVLMGEAEAYPTPQTNVKPIKVKEDHAITFGLPTFHSVEFEPFQASGDLLPREYADNHGDGPGYYAYGPYAGFYGYGYPYYAYDYPFWGWGYPGFGFGYYGGYYGGFRGGYGGGFHGGGFHGGGGRR
jgi:uncharacterized membrane protein YgcG